MSKGLLSVVTGPSRLRCRGGQLLGLAPGAMVLAVSTQERSALDKAPLTDGELPLG
ncbi:hypothetical protein [Streptomyces sp. NRRL S-1022]|uniref:hypothetical protein n=1 Tax=Streptomyces sp. NRRL S-1022 TaxID=1463880 RepID=UPI000AE448C3|nr:hypothetical protein [Streptomyces sp. NRRL S-1022]